MFIFEELSLFMHYGISYMIRVVSVVSSKFSHVVYTSGVIVVLIWVIGIIAFICVDGAQVFNGIHIIYVDGCFLEDDSSCGYRLHSFVPALRRHNMIRMQKRNQFKSNQMKSNRIKSNQIESNEYLVDSLTVVLSLYIIK